MLCFLSVVIGNSFRGFQSIAVKPTKFTSCHMAASNQNGAASTCAGTGNGAWPEIDVEGSGVMVDPPSTGADTVVVGVAAPCGGKCLPPPWPHPQPQKGGYEPSSLGSKCPLPPPPKGIPSLLLPALLGDCPICRISSGKRSLLNISLKINLPN